MLCTSINNIAAVHNNAMDFEASLTSTTAATILDSTPAAVTTTTATITAAPATTTASTPAATTTAVCTYTLCSDISTITSDPSPVTLLPETLSPLRREFIANETVGLLQHAAEIATWKLGPQRQANFILEIYDLLYNITNATNAQVTRQSIIAERNVD